MQVSLEEQVGGGVLNLALERRVIKAWTGERPSQALDGDGLFNREQLSQLEKQVSQPSSLTRAVSSETLSPGE